MSTHALVTTAEASEALAIHPETLRRLYRSGTLPGYKVGRHLRFDLDEIRSALRTERGTAGAVTTSPNFAALDPTVAR